MGAAVPQAAPPSLTRVVPLPPPPQVPQRVGNVYDLEVIPLGYEPEQIDALRRTIEAMGDYLFERDGHYFVSTTRANMMRTVLMQQHYVASVI